MKDLTETVQEVLEGVKDDVKNLIQGIKDGDIQYVDFTQKNKSGHTFYLKGKPSKPEASFGFIRVKFDRDQFIEVNPKLIQKVVVSQQAASIYLKK
jgi:hypothetical protein